MDRCGPGIAPEQGPHPNPFIAQIKKGGDSMASQGENSNLLSFKELLMANAIHIDAVTDLLIELSIITEQEFNSKLQEV